MLPTKMLAILALLGYFIDGGVAASCIIIYIHRSRYPGAAPNFRLRSPSKMTPSLRFLKNPLDTDYWDSRITNEDSRSPMALPRLTKLELQIMDALWTHGAISIREIQEAFPEK